MLDSNLIKVKVIEETDSYGKFEIEPLDKGYAQTIGTSLRRVLLSSLKGAAVTAVKITGAKNEYSTIPGVEEDVLNIILNLKQLKLRSFSDEPETVYLNVKKAGQIEAGNFEASANVEILNPDLVIATLADSKSSLVMEVTVEKGTGYVNPETNRSEIGLIPVDADFSPVERVNFSVGSARVGQVTDLDKLTLEIMTRSVKPSEALYQALAIYTDMLAVIRDQIEVTPEEPREPVKVKKTTKKSSKK